jgi:hypothetical protein
MDLQASSWLGSAVLLLSCSVPLQDDPGDKLSHHVHSLKDEKAYAAVYMMDDWTECRGTARGENAQGRKADR